jgi:hypothetical protein
MEIEHIKNRGSHFGPEELDHYFPRYGAVMSLVTELVTHTQAPFHRAKHRPSFRKSHTGRGMRAQESGPIC